MSEGIQIDMDQQNQNQKRNVVFYKIDKDGSYTTRTVVIGGANQPDFADLCINGWIIEHQFKILKELIDLKQKNVVIPEDELINFAAKFGINLNTNTAPLVEKKEKKPRKPRAKKEE